MMTRNSFRRARHYAKAAAAVLALVATTGCVGSGGGQGITPIEESSIGLAAFDDCPQLLNYFHEEAIFLLENIENLAPHATGVAVGAERGAADDNALGAPEAQAPGGGNDGEGGAGPAFSGTNLQERGVDEPDIVKTDGRFIYVSQGGRLLIHRADDLTEISRTDLATHDATLFLSGDQVIAVGRYHGELDPAFGMPDGDENRWTPRVSIEVFDVSDRATPSRIRQTFVDGELQTARLVNRAVRVVAFFQGGNSLRGAIEPPRRGPDSPPIAGGVGTEPSEPVEVEVEENASSDEDDGQFGEAESPLEVEDGDEVDEDREAWLARVRETIEATTLENWLPKRYDTIDGAHTTEQVTSCGQFHRPGERSGLGVVAILSIDLDAPADIIRDSAVVTGPGVAYASGESLYLTTGNRHGMVRRAVDGGDVVEVGEDIAVSSPTAATPSDSAEPEDGEDLPAMGQRQDPLEEEDIQATQIHRLDISGPSARYIGSGRVRGLPLNSFSLSEHNGHLRIATTEERWQQNLDSVNHLFVLENEDRNDDGELSVTGHIGEIAVTERIYAARFMGDKGFLVTFRQVDPLFTIDLADPTAPRIVGELKVPGFSTYLHPYGDEHLMGIGQSATEEGRITGMQLSLFDVSDFADPTLAHDLPLGDGHSEALYDHHAFTFWAPESLLMIPMMSYDREGDRSGIEFFHVDAMTGFEARGFVGHDDLVEDKWSRVRRALVIGENVISVGQLGMKSNAMDTLDESARVVFPEARGHRGHGDEPDPAPLPAPAPEPADDPDGAEDSSDELPAQPEAG